MPGVVLDESAGRRFGLLRQGNPGAAGVQGGLSESVYFPLIERGQFRSG